MRRLTLFATFALLASACSAAATPTESAQAAFEAYVAAINAGDVERAADFYDDDPDFHWVERGEVQYRSAEEAAESLAGLTSYGGTPEMTVDQVLVVDLDDNAAFLTAHFEFAMIGPDDATLFQFGGWMSVAMVKRDDGWKIAAGQSGPDKADQASQAR